MRQVTLKGLAAELGVSHTLVSRVLSGRMGTTRVSEQTRQAILKRAKELEFQPNRLAKALKQGRKGVVGVFIHHVGTAGSDLSEHFVQSASDRLSEHGSRLWLRFFETGEDFLRACNDRLIREVDGLIVGGIAHDELTDKLAEIDRGGLPVVCAFHQRRNQPYLPNFQVDHSQQSYLATKHLIDQGCERIAYFQCLMHRRAGFERALREAGREVDPALVVTAKLFKVIDGVQCMHWLMKRDRPFDGIVTESDAQAAGAMNVWLREHRQFENWPKIVGIDNSPIATNCIIPLTSVTAEMEATAQASVDALYAKLDGGTADSAFLPPKLVARESTMANHLTNGTGT